MRRQGRTLALEAWAAALRRAVEELAAEGVHLDHAGEVSSEPLGTAWGWEDEAPALARRQAEYMY